MANRPGTRWLTAAYDDPERNLLAAVIHKAIRDARCGTAAVRNDALAYLNGRNFESDCTWLNLDPVRVRTLLQVTP